MISGFLSAKARAVLALLYGCMAACGPAAAAAAADISYQARHESSRPSASTSGSRLPYFEELAALPQVTALAVPRAEPALAAEPPARDVWERMRRRFAMPVLAGPLVQRQQTLYLQRQDMLKGILQRSRRYLYHVVSELERRNMPMELALLPMVESGYNPQALSHAQASGLWQFIPKTAKKYELVLTNTYDARRDVLASTRAALDYLQFLHGLMGDWHLALASYNWGEEQVMAARERNRARGLPEHYEALTVPEETRLYVPKLQALKNILADPEAYGITLDPLPNEPYFVAVENARSLDMRQAAKLAEISVDEFLALNPAYNGPTVSASDTKLVLVPADKAEVFSRNLESLPSAGRKPRATPPREALTAGDPTSNQSTP